MKIQPQRLASHKISIFSAATSKGDDLCQIGMRLTYVRLLTPGNYIDQIAQNLDSYMAEV